MPHAMDKIQINSKGSQFLDAQRNIDTNTSTSFDKSYFVYVYDDLNGCMKDKLPFTIPGWVTSQALSVLKDEKLKNDSHNAQEMEKGWHVQCYGFRKKSFRCISIRYHTRTNRGHAYYLTRLKGFSP